MEDLISNILRGSVTSVMNVILLFTLTRPKYGPGSTAIAATVIFVVNIATTFWFYLYSDLTSLARFDLVMFIALGFLLKPFSKTSFLQWGFNYLTTINITMIIIFLSFHLGKLFPYPEYAHTIIRFALYLGVVFLVQRYLQPLYQTAPYDWRIFSFLGISIFINLSFYFYVAVDIQETLASEKWPMSLLILLSFAAYGTVFYALRSFTAMHELETENLKHQHEHMLLSQATSSMSQRLLLMEKVSYEHSIASHDRRHFNNMLLALLQRGEIEEAISSLHTQNEIKLAPDRIYCENKAVNAVVSYYVDLASHKGIETHVALEIGEPQSIESVELALVVANLLENAIRGVSLLPNGQHRYIHLACRQVGRYLLEITNSCLETVTLGPDGRPYSLQDGHGVGTESVAAFADKYDGELLYQVQDGQFRVRLLV